MSGNIINIILKQVNELCLMCMKGYFIIFKQNTTIKLTLHSFLNLLFLRAML